MDDALPTHDAKALRSVACAGIPLGALMTFGLPFARHFLGFLGALCGLIGCSIFVCCRPDACGVRAIHRLSASGALLVLMQIWLTSRFLVTVEDRHLGVGFSKCLEAANCFTPVVLVDTCNATLSFQCYDKSSECYGTELTSGGAASVCESANSLCGLAAVWRSKHDDGGKFTGFSSVAACKDQHDSLRERHIALLTGVNVGALILEIGLFAVTLATALLARRTLKSAPLPPPADTPAVPAVAISELPASGSVLSHVVARDTHPSALNGKLAKGDTAVITAEAVSIPEIELGQIGRATTAPGPEAEAEKGGVRVSRPGR